MKIWHKADERPEPFKTFVFKTDKGNTCSDMLSTNSGWNPILLPEFYNMDDFDKAEHITKWAYLNDLLALEHENAQLTHKVAVALAGLKYIQQNCLEYAADYMDYADTLIERIKDTK